MFLTTCRQRCGELLLQLLTRSCWCCFAFGVEIEDACITTSRANRHLDLSNNNYVAASAPSVLATMTSLTYLDLSNNAIGGSLPSALAAGLAYVVAFTPSQIPALLFPVSVAVKCTCFVAVAGTSTCSTT